MITLSSYDAVWDGALMDYIVPKVEPAATRWRRVVLFGSISQFVSYLFCVSAVILVAALVVDIRSAAPATTLIVGALLGAIPSVIRVLQFPQPER
jgi:hypothetical protein